MKKIEKSWKNNGERESKGEKTERDVRLYLNFLSELSLWLFIYVVVNFLFQVIFVFLLFLGMVIYANEVETKEKQKLPEIKN